MCRLSMWDSVVLFTFGLSYCFAQTKTSSHDCPFPISVPNGGFESGKISPWQEAFNTGPSNASIYCPGYKSKYALRIDAPRLEGDQEAGYELLLNTTGKVCYGYYYNISVAYNWLHYVGPPAPNDDSVACYLSISTEFCDAGVYVTPLGKPGWHTTSVIARDRYSYCKNLRDVMAINTNCFTRFENSTGIPGYSLLIDDVQITAVTDRTPTPPLPTDPQTCENHS